MSAIEFTDRRDDRFFRGKDTPGRSRTQIRAEEAGAWSQDLETSVYGEDLWTLPGKDGKGKDCGVWGPRRFCESENAHIQFGPHRCGNRGCPDCWSTWARDRAVAITARMSARRISAPDGEKRAIHGQVSPPEDTVQTRQDAYDMWRESYQLAEGKGVRGGASILHCYRVKDEIKDLIELERERDEYEGGDWKWVREHERHWRDLVYWSPHVHVIGWVGSNDVKPGDTDADDGWVWKNIRSLEPQYLHQAEGYEDVGGLSMYLLSHMTYEAEETKQGIRWFGELSNASFNPEEPLTQTAWQTVQRRSEEAVGGTYGDDEEEETPMCEHDGCEHPTHDIYQDGRDYLEQRGDHLTEEGFNRLNTAIMWAMQEIHPPPGLKKPTTDQQCIESFDAML